MTRYAINIADLTRHDQIVIACTVQPVTPERQIVKTGPNLDDSAVVLQCPDRQALAIVELLRHHDLKVKRYQTRAYAEGSRGGWHHFPKAKTSPTWHQDTSEGVPA